MMAKERGFLHEYFNTFLGRNTMFKIGCAEMVFPKFKRASECGVGACAEAAVSGEKVLVRQSERPDIVVLFTPEEWRAFVKGVKAGEFDC